MVSEVLKSYLNDARDVRDVCFYRDGRKREIDLVIQEGRVLHPVEVKLAATVPSDATQHFALLDDIDGYERGFGHVICQTRRPYGVSRTTEAIPVWAI